MQTSLTRLLGIQHPIIQAPIGSATSPELVAAVSNAGGLGLLALSWTDAATTRALIRRTRQLTSRPFGVNLVLAFDQAERVQICGEERVPIVNFSWGDSEPFIEPLQAAGVLIGQTVASAAAAGEYEARGVDFLIAQGWEAGGHVLGTVATSVLIPAITDQVRLPVVAAGGIADGRGILAALSLGAAGACLGTRFLLAREAQVDPEYQRLIAQAAETDTVYAGRLFNLGWDNAPHRTLRNSTVRAWEAAGCPPVGQRPGEGEIIAFRPTGQPILRYSDDGPLAHVTGELEALALYAGQSAGLLTEIRDAAQIVADLARDLDHEFGRLGQLFAE